MARSSPTIRARRRSGASSPLASPIFSFPCYWIADAFLVEPDAYLIFIWMPLVLLPGGLAFLLAWAMRFAFQFWCPGPARLIIFSVALMVSEWVRGALFGLGGLPWNLPAMVWTAGGAVSQTASIWGVYGLSLLTIVALASPAALADARPRGTTASRAAPVLVAAVAFGAIWGWGASRLATVPDDQGGPMVRLVEAGVPQKDKYQPRSGELMVQRFRDLSGPDTPTAPGILVWPEGALPYWLFEWPDALDAVTESAGQPQADHRHRAARKRRYAKGEGLQQPRRAECRERCARTAGDL